MNYSPMQTSHLERYLDILGIENKHADLEGLEELLRAHFCRIPFENISKIYYLKRENLRYIPDLELFLEGIERFNFGGTCFSSNFYLHQLLANLGYDVMLCGADMTNPDVHLVNIVTIDGLQYLVDVGYAAPFLSPLPLEKQTDIEIKSGEDLYVLKPRDNEGRSHLQLFRNGKIKHGYSIIPRSRNISEFEDVIVDSFRTEATFLNSVLLTKYCSTHSTVIHNLSMIQTERSSKNVTKFTDRKQLAQAINDNFSIPLEISHEVISELGPLGDAWN